MKPHVILTQREKGDSKFPKLQEEKIDISKGKNDVSKPYQHVYRQKFEPQTQTLLSL